MKPIHFPQANKTLTAPDGALGEGIQIEPLPVHTDGTQCLSCWELTWPERVQALLHGRVWLCAQTGGTQPPVWLAAARTVPIPKNQNRGTGVPRAV